MEIVLWQSPLHSTSLLLAILFVTAFATSIVWPAGGALITDHVVINEFERNPPGDERYTGGEFIELFNPTAVSVDVGGWTLSTTHGKISSYTIPEFSSMMALGPVLLVSLLIISRKRKQIPRRVLQPNPTFSPIGRLRSGKRISLNI